MANMLGDKTIILIISSAANEIAWYFVMGLPWLLHIVSDFFLQSLSLSPHTQQCASWISYSQVTQTQKETEVESEREKGCEGAREEGKEAKRRPQMERAPVRSVCAYIHLPNILRP